MNRGLLAKGLRESWPGTLLLGLSLALAETVLVYAIDNFSREISRAWSTLPFVQYILRGLLGETVGGQIGPEILTSITWIHPVILALMWTHAIAYCTRMPAGEVDRGTIDVLLGLPISRWQLYAMETLAWLGSGIAIVAMVVAGNLIGGKLVARGNPFDVRRVVIVSTNLLCLYVAVGGLAWLASALSDRRGRAIGVVIAVVLASFLLNYLAQFWSPAESLSFLGMLHYYRPLAILRDAAWPVRDITVLITAGFATWLAGGLIFARRDLATL